MPKSSIQEEFLSTDNFQLAWKRVLRSIHFENKDRISLRVFASNIDFHIQLLIDQIRTNTYTPKHAHKLYLPKSSRTLRTIPVLSIQDRVVYQAIGNIIIQEATPHLLALSDRHIFAHIPDSKDSLFAMKRWSNQFNKFSRKYEEIWKQDNRWVVEADISAFYSSINHQLLTDLIRHRWISDENFLTLLNSCLSKWSPHEKGPELNSGLPQGYETSDLLSTVFLLPIDEKMVVGYRYIRYVDDIRILAPDQNTASKALVALDLALQARSLILQTKKTGITEITNVQDEKVNLRHRFSLINMLTTLGINQKNEFKAMFLDALSNLSKSPKEFKRAKIFPLIRLRITTTTGKIISKLFKHFPWKSKIFYNYLQSYRLKSMFLDAWHNLKITPETSDTTIAFTLYRLDADIKIGKIALRLLEMLPARSKIINNYLEKFGGEKQIIDGVLQEIRLHTVYAWHLANCIRTISKIADIAVYRQVALEWINNPMLTWPQRLSAIEVLYEDEESHASLFGAITSEQNIILKRALITACAIQAYKAGKIQEVCLLIRECLQYSDDEIKLLGIWLFRQFPSLSWLDINFQDSLGILQPLIPEAPQEQAETPCFIKQTLRSQYGVKIKEETDFKNFFFRLQWRCI